MDTKQLEEKKNTLTPEQYNVCFLKGTEPPFSGKYADNKEVGMYVCVVCGQELFASDTKYDSKTGWPSFWNTVGEENVVLEDDFSLGMRRIEVLCKNCGSHLGHVFDDGPRVLPDGRQATGKRYCINSLALNFIPKK